MAIEDELNASRDRITKMLSQAATSGPGDVTTALIRASGVHPLSNAPGFGEQLNSLRAQRLQSEMGLQQVLSSEMKSRAEMRKEGREEEKLNLEKLKLLRSMGNDHAEAIGKGLDKLFVNPRARQKALEYMQGDPIYRDISPDNAQFYVADVQRKMLEKGLIKDSDLNKEDTSSSEFERSIGELVTSGQITQEQAQQYKKDRVEILAQGGQGVTERQVKQYVDIGAKIKDGTATPADRATYDVLRYKWSRFLPVPEVGVVPITPPGSGGGYSVGGAAGGVSQAPAQPSSQSPAPTVNQPAQGGRLQSGPEARPGVIPGTQPRPKILPSETQQEFQQVAISTDAMKMLEEGIGQTGPIIGWSRREFAKKFGGNQAILNFDTGYNNLRLGAQALIKGIPSNFDVQTVLDTLPAIDLDPQANQTRLAFTKNAFRNLMAIKIGYYKGLNYQIPESVLSLAGKMGIDANSIGTLTETEVRAATDNLATEAASAMAVEKFGRENIEGISFFSNKFHVKLKDGSWQTLK